MTLSVHFLVPVDNRNPIKGNLKNVLTVFLSNSVTFCVKFSSFFLIHLKFQIAQKTNKKYQIPITSDILNYLEIFLVVQ